MNLSLCARLDAIADALWPAHDQELLGPWKLRASGGRSYRVNSVLTAPAAALQSSGNTGADRPYVERLVRWAEQFYRQRRAAPVFYLSPASYPIDLDAMLAMRRYAVERSSEVWTAPVQAVLDRTTAIAPTADLTLDGKPDHAWLDCVYGGSSRRQRQYRQILRRMLRPCAFASVRISGETVACGMSGIADGWAGLFCMATQLPHRRRGYATAIVQHLAGWAASQGAAQMLLQVLASNEPAKCVYQRCGFVFCYPYHYRVGGHVHG